MRIRGVGSLGWMAAWLLASAAPAFPAAKEVPQPLMGAAQCMVRILSGTSGVSDAHVDVPESNGAAYPVVSYRFADAEGRRRFTELSLFEISGIEGAPYVFDRSDIEGDPVAERLLATWKTRCHAGYGYITSNPGR
jgi:hypothetical protein